MAIDRDTVITSLGQNDSFYDWFTKENEFIIPKLNAINTYTVEGGDGITAPIAITGKATISLSGKVDGGISFNGPVYFNNFVSVPNIAIRVTGITSGSSGYTLGTPVRVFYDIVTNKQTYEPARGNDPDQAEVMGLISSLDSSGAYVTVLGQVTGNFSNINTRGVGLTAGWIYFLDPGTTGYITDVEPNQTGQVSKPVLMGLTGNVGVVLQMRGNYLNSEGFTGGTGAFDRIIINTGNTDIETSTSINIGTSVSLTRFASVSRAALTALGYEIYGGIAGSDIPTTHGIIATMSPRDLSWTSGGVSGVVTISDGDCLGIVTDIFTIGGQSFIEVGLHGYTDALSSYSTGTYYINPSFSANAPTVNSQYTTIESSKCAFIKYSSNGAIIVNKTTSGSTQRSGELSGYNTYVTTSGLTGGLNQGTNYLVNGNFAVWQRDSTGRGNAYTNTGSLVFADMWRRHDDVTGSDGTKSYSIIRAEFDEYQSQIEGNPQYYLTVQALGLSAIGLSGATGYYDDYDHMMIGHVVPGAKKFDMNNLIVKFYGKVSANTYPVDVYLSRYTGLSLINYTKLGTANLTANWQPFVFNKTIQPLANEGIDIDLDDDYCEIGIDLIPLMQQANISGITLGQSLTVDVASFVATVGTATPVAIYEEYNDQLKYCQQFYYTNYSKNQEIGSITMSDVTSPTSNVESFFIQPNKTCSFYKWPVEMRIAPTVQLYSPLSGIQNDAYNKTISLDMRNTSGTLGYGDAVRSAPIGQSTIEANSYQNGYKICVNNGYVNYDEVYFNITANADFSI
jgi:hypothetical protein